LIITLAASEPVERYQADPEEIIDIVERVRDVICPIHDCRFGRLAGSQALVKPFTTPVEVLLVNVVCPVLSAAVSSRRSGPWIF
jgi:hypothetical protein